MRLSSTLSRYLGSQFLIGLSVVFFAVVCVIFMFDTVELIRRAAGRESATFGIILSMAALKLPKLSEEALPFAALFGAMWTFAKLTRTHELVVARAAGVSVWQFLTPPILLALVIGTVAVTVFDPVASIMISRYEHLESKHLHGRPSLLAISSSGLWMRQVDDSGQSVIHAARLAQQEPELELEDVIIFLYEGTDKFTGRIDADRARLMDGYWLLNKATLTGPNVDAERRDTHLLKTSLTAARIQESFAPPETMSFWALPRFIRVLEAAGFSALKHRLHWYSLLSSPLLICAMVLIAATFSLRMTRRGKTGLMVAGGVMVGFVLYFLSDLTYALGLSGSIPPVLAAWTPTGVSLLLGISMLLHLEDG
ncbi:MAG: LPS export ABC transporter permease LptG [Rhodospirillales bacterium]|nr:LPS export ABC transporter permease LptG [Rhodospirillales bacterium]